MFLSCVQLSQEFLVLFIYGTRIYYWQEEKNGAEGKRKTTDKQYQRPSILRRGPMHDGSVKFMLVFCQLWINKYVVPLLRVPSPNIYPFLPIQKVMPMLRTTNRTSATHQALSSPARAAGPSSWPLVLLPEKQRKGRDDENIYQKRIGLDNAELHKHFKHIHDRFTLVIDC